MSENLFRVDNILWKIDMHGLDAIPICPIHAMELTIDYSSTNAYEDNATRLLCDDCEEPFPIPRRLIDEKEYIKRKVKSKVYKGMKILNLDDEAIPIAKDKTSMANSDYFITSLLTESKLGLRLVVYAGKKGAVEKSQIFIEPDIKRLAFDQKDLHPTEVFTSLEAIFKDGTKASLKKHDQL